MSLQQGLDGEAPRRRARETSEGAALLSYVLGAPPRGATLRRFLRGWRHLEFGAPLLPEAVLRCPPLLRVLEPLPGDKRPRAVALRARLVAAAFIADTEPGRSGRLYAYAAAGRAVAAVARHGRDGSMSAAAALGHQPLAVAMSDPIVVIGTGPASVTAARRLLDAGLPITLIDAGLDVAPALRTDRPPLVDLRHGSKQAWHYLIGEDFRGMRFMPSVSPKLRLAHDPENFSAFTALNQIQAENFIPLGCLATGGLSNIWGAVAFAYDDADMNGWPIRVDQMAQHYRDVSSRMGLSGPPATDLDRSATPLVLQDALPLAPIEARIVASYVRTSKRPGFRLGQARTAVLSADHNGRMACTLDNTCLLGCERGAIYASAYDAAELARHAKATVLQGFVVEKLSRNDAGWSVEGHDRRSGSRRSIAAAKIVLAAGALASTRLALDAARFDAVPVRIENSPQIAFAALFPAAIGSQIPAKAFGLAQLAFSRALGGTDPADEMLGFLYPAYSMSAAEYLPRMPVSIAGGMALLRDLLPGLMIGLASCPAATATIAQRSCRDRAVWRGCGSMADIRRRFPPY